LDRLKGFISQSSRQSRTGVAPVSNSLMPLEREIFGQRQAGSLSYN